MADPPDRSPAAPLSERASASPVRAYLDLQVGTRSYASLFQYELLASVGGPLPGALGLAFRRLLWGRLFAESGRKVVWGRNVVLRHPRNMSIGDNVLVGDDCLLDARGCAPGEFRIGDEVMISRGCILSGKEAKLELGPRVNIGSGCQIWSLGGVSIGADTLLAGNCYVGGGTYDADGPIDRPMAEQPLEAGFVEIGDDCWLGAGVVVIAGVTVGHGAVIGAGSVVTRDIAPYSVAVGAPAKVIRRRRCAPPIP